MTGEKTFEAKNDEETKTRRENGEQIAIEMS